MHTVAVAEIIRDPAFTSDPESFRDIDFQISKHIRVVIEVAKAGKIMSHSFFDRATAVLLRMGRGVVKVRITRHQLLRTSCLRIRNGCHRAQNHKNRHDKKTLAMAFWNFSSTLYFPALAAMSLLKYRLSKSQLRKVTEQKVNKKRVLIGRGLHTR